MKRGVWITGGIVVVIAVIVIVVLAQHNKANAPTKSDMNMPSSSSSSNANSTSSNKVATDKVTIQNFAFSPANITVKVGTKVTWTNQDSTAHTVTADDSSAGFDSGTLDSGKSYSFTFAKAGTFAYHCNFHSDMHGTVTVTE